MAHGHEGPTYNEKQWEHKLNQPDAGLDWTGLQHGAEIGNSGFNAVPA